MNIRSSGRTIVICRPCGIVNRLANFQIHSELLDDLPSKAHIHPAAQTVRRRDRKSIEHVVLV